MVLGDVSDRDDHGTTDSPYSFHAKLMQSSKSHDHRGVVQDELLKSSEAMGATQ